MSLRIAIKNSFTFCISEMNSSIKTVESCSDWSNDCVRLVLFKMFILSSVLSLITYTTSKIMTKQTYGLFSRVWVIGHKVFNMAPTLRGDLTCFKFICKLSYKTYFYSGFSSELTWYATSARNSSSISRRTQEFCGTLTIYQIYSLLSFL